MKEELRALYQELILEHGTEPRNCYPLAEANGVAEGINPLCGDAVKVYVHIDGDIVHKVSFQGSGCAISVASASMMTELFVGKSLSEVKSLCESFKQTLTQTHERETPELGKAQALCGVKAFPSRVKCATLAWHTALAALKDQSGIVVSTECE